MITDERLEELIKDFEEHGCFTIYEGNPYDDEIFDLLIEIRELRKQNKALIADAEMVFAELEYQVKCSNDPDLHSLGNCTFKHKELMESLEKEV